jgi:hypothetical protein
MAVRQQGIHALGSARLNSEAHFWNDATVLSQRGEIVPAGGIEVLLESTVGQS